MIRLVNRYGHLNWTLADQAVVSASNFLTGVIIARELGVEAFGLFSIAWLILLFVQSLQISLIISPMLSIGPKTDSNQSGAYFGSLLPLQLLFSLLSAGIAGLLATYGGQLVGMNNSGTTLALPLALAVFATQLHEYGRRYAYACTQPSVALRMDLVRYAVQFALFYYTFSSDHSTVQGALYIVALSALLGMWADGTRRLTLSFEKTDIHLTTKRHWIMSRWLLPSALLQWTSGNAFTLAAAALLGPAPVGAMRMAQNLMGITHVFFQALDNWAPVRASHVYAQQGSAALKRFTHKVLVISVSITAAVAISLTIPAEFWLEVIYGEEYVPYAWLVRLYGATYTLIATTAPFRYALISLEKTKSIFLGYAFSTALTALTAYPLVSLLGLQGAMVGVLSCQALILLTVALHYKKVTA